MNPRFKCAKIIRVRSFRNQITNIRNARYVGGSLAQLYYVGASVLVCIPNASFDFVIDYTMYKMLLSISKLHVCVMEQSSFCLLRVISSTLSHFRVVNDVMIKVTNPFVEFRTNIITT